MSKMSEIHFEITSIGEDEIFRIETCINRLKEHNVSKDKIIEHLYKHNMINKDTAIMLIAGAKEHKYSKLIRRQLDD